MTFQWTTRVETHAQPFSQLSLCQPLHAIAVELTSLFVLVVGGQAHRDIETAGDYDDVLVPASGDVQDWLRQTQQPRCRVSDWKELREATVQLLLSTT